MQHNVEGRLTDGQFMPMKEPDLSPTTSLSLASPPAKGAMPRQHPSQLPEAALLTSLLPSIYRRDHPPVRQNLFRCLYLVQQERKVQVTGYGRAIDEQGKRGGGIAVCCRPVPPEDEVREEHAKQQASEPTAPVGMWSARGLLMCPRGASGERFPFLERALRGQNRHKHVPDKVALSARVATPLQQVDSASAVTQLNEA